MSRHCGVPSQEELVGQEPSKDVLRRFEPVDTQDQGALTHQVAELLAHALGLGLGRRLAQRLGAHRHGEGAHRGVAFLDLHAAAAEHMELGQAPRRQQVVLGPLLGLEAQDVGAGESPEQRGPHADRQDPEVGGTGERRVREVHDLGLGHEFTQHAGHQAQVVVLDQVHGVVLGFVGEGVGERAVGLDVVVPGGLGGVVEHRRAGDVPQRVVDEPQDPVRDLVVVAVVALLRHHDVAHALVRIGSHRPAFQGHRAIAVGHGRGHPGGVVPVEHPGQRRDQPAGAAPGRQPASIVPIEADGPSVGRHHHRRLHGADGGAGSVG